METNSAQKTGAHGFDAVEIMPFTDFKIALKLKINAETMFSVFNDLLPLKQTNKQKFRMVEWNKTILNSWL